jgi:hypothetical protein
MLLILVLVVVVIIVVSAFAFLQGPVSDCTATWNCTADYPIQYNGTPGVAAQQCAASGSNIFCVGGQDANGGPRNEVYSASADPASGNLSGWVLSQYRYPQTVAGESCVTSSGFEYCIGGIYDDNFDAIASSYFAQLESNGSVGAWEPTTSYPIPTNSQSCVAALSFVYCIGGANETGGLSAAAALSSSDWYAPLGSSGIGTWSKTTPFPANLYLPSCFESSGFVYCVGGEDSGGNSVGTSYFAPLSADGIGNWTQTTTYPVQASGDACAVSSSVVYCVGGETAGGQNPTFTSAVYYASLSSSGIGSWNQSPDFPQTVGSSCVIAAGDIYCVGGFDASTAGLNSLVRYASLSSLSA